MFSHNLYEPPCVFSKYFHESENIFNRIALIFLQNLTFLHEGDVEPIGCCTIVIWDGNPKA